MFNIFNIFKKTNESLTADIIKENDKILGMLYEGIVGDYLGVPFEFTKRNEVDFTGPIEFGTHNQPLGTWSDDTSLSLCLIDNIIECWKPSFYTDIVQYNNNVFVDNNIVLCDLMQRFLNCKRNGSYTPAGRLFDCGTTINQSLVRFEMNRDLSSCGGRDSDTCGNGTIMRIAPLISLQKVRSLTDSKLYDLSYAYTHITHNTEVTVLGSFIYLKILIELYKYPEDAISSILNKIDSSVQKLIEIGKVSPNAYTHYRKLLSTSFVDLPYESIKSSGYVVDTLESAVWLLNRFSSYKESMRSVMELGMDTDTLGQVLGSMIGIRYGYSAVPLEWINYIQNKIFVDEKIIKLINFKI